MYTQALNVKSASPLLHFDYTVESDHAIEDHFGEQVLEESKTLQRSVFPDSVVPDSVVQSGKSSNKEQSRPSSQRQTKSSAVFVGQNESSLKMVVRTGPPVSARPKPKLAYPRVKVQPKTLLARNIQ